MLLPGVASPFAHPQVVPQVSPEPVLRARVPSPTPQISSNSSVDLSEADTSVDFSWHPDEDDIAYFPNLATDSLASLPLGFLQTPLPHGLGFSPDCSTWLNKLGIQTWDEIVSHSTTYTVYSMMSTLSVPVYYQHRKDIR